MYYFIEELPGIPGFSDPSGAALNDNGDVAGAVFQSVGSQGGLTNIGAIWYPDGSTQTLPVASELSCINDEGTAAGAAWGTKPADPNPYAILVQNKVVVDLESTAGPESAARCINNGFNGPSLACVTTSQGEVLAIDSLTHMVAFKFTAGVGWVLQPLTINENSDIAGWAFLDMLPTSFLYKGGVMMNNTPADGGIHELNNSGQGGGYYGASGQTIVPAIWDTTGSMPASKHIPLPLLQGCDGGTVFGINDSGWAVGYCNNSGNPNKWYAFVYDGNKTTDLNTLITAPGWTLQSANVINNSGQILGTGTLNGNPTSFLLTPIASPWQSANVNALLYAMLFGGVANDGGGPTLLGGRIPYPVGPWDPSILSPAAQDAVIGLAVDAVARRLGDRVGSEAIRKAALEMTARAISRLMAPTISNASQSVPRPRAAARPVRPRGRFPFPPRPGSKPPKG